MTGATTLYIDQGIGSVLGNSSQIVAPSQTTTYTLTLNGSVSAQVTVTVVPAPSITSFDASPTMISVGGSATLTAVFSGGTGTVDHGIGSLTSAVGKGSGAIAATTTYTLTVTNVAGDSTTAQVTVTVVPPPSIASFVASPTVISIGGSATLTGEFSGGTGIVDQGIGDVTSGSGTSTGALAATTTYTLTVTNSVGDSTAAQVTVTVVPLPSITSFGANPTAVNLGGSATLTAVFSGGIGSVDQGVDTVTSGSGKSTGTVAANTTYTLTVTSPAGDSTTAQVIVVGGISTPTGSMTVARSEHTATSFTNDGKVLITGGSNGTDYLSSAEIYDPAGATFTATTGSMAMTRYLHTATLLSSGMVLIVGGTFSPPGRILELYDNGTGTFTASGSVTFIRIAHTATLLAGGMVLIAGGAAGGSAASSARLYDATAATFTATGSMTSPRAYHTAILLPSGKVLLAGGEGNTVPNPTLASADLYDPSAGTCTATGSMTVARAYHTATLLNNGKVLVAGGSASQVGTLASADLYDPGAGIFTATGSMTVARSQHTATLLSNGKVLIAGGGVASTELYDPSTGTFTATGNMTEVRSQHTANLLPSGMVLIAGGSSDMSAELFK